MQQLEEISKVAAGLLLEQGLSICTAESCTGGLVASSLIDHPGISAVFRAGFITYSNESKSRLLGVPEEILKKHGAVSEETAAAMAKGAAEAVQAETAISVTGIAGPDGGTPDKPVGLVYIGCYYCGTVSVQKKVFQGSRKEIRTASAVAALCLLQEQITECSPKDVLETGANLHHNIRE